ncbi:hypothetical protein TNCV_4124521 [Trichonephila clavipes]|nr:hypothetical protein TNCV_4124521 [Trichonephila clavipes]
MKIGNNGNLVLGPFDESKSVVQALSKALRLLGHDGIFVNEWGNNALRSSEGQGDFRLIWLGSLLGFLANSHYRGSQYDLELTVRPQSSLMRLSPQFYFGIELC